MISAFKHIRLSGYNLTPVAGTDYNNNSILRLGLGNTGIAYYHELTGISGYLNNLITIANADVSSLNNLQGGVKITGGNGISILVDSITNEITVSGNNNAITNLIGGLSGQLNITGSNLYSYISSLSGELDQTQIDLANTGSTLYSYTTSLSGALNASGNALYNLTTALSGAADAKFVKRSSQQVFTTSLTQGTDSYAIFYPVSFSTAPKVQATLEVGNDVMYNLSIKSISAAGYTGLLSDDLAEAGAKIHTFASVQQNPAVAD